MTKFTKAERELCDLVRDQGHIGSKITQKEKEIHKHFVSDRKTLFRILDVVFILTILMNLGAIAMTDYMVQKNRYIEAEEKNLTVEFIEANPIKAKTGGYKVAEDTETKTRVIAMIISLLSTAFIWSLMTYYYLKYRLNARHMRHVYRMMSFISVWFIVLAIDFFHDFGLFIAKIIYGG